MTTDPQKPDTAGTEIALARVPADTSGYLGDPDTVLTLVKNAVLDVRDRSYAAAEGKITEAEFIKEALVQRDGLTDIFLGKNPAFAPVGPWNTGGQLAQVLHERFFNTPYDGNALETMRESFALFITTIAGAMKRYFSDEMAAPDVETLMKSEIVNWTSLLLYGTVLRSTLNDGVAS